MGRRLRLNGKGAARSTQDKAEDQEARGLQALGKGNKRAKGEG